MKPEKADLQIVGENKYKNQAIHYLGTGAKMLEWLSPTPDVCEMAHYLSSIVWLISMMPCTPLHFCAVAAFQEVKLESCPNLQREIKKRHGIADNTVFFFCNVFKSF